MECRLLVSGEQLSTQLTFEKLIALWYTDVLKPFEEIRNEVENLLGFVHVTKLAAYISFLESTAMIEYIVKTKDSETNVVIACADDLEASFEKFRKMKENNVIRQVSVNDWLIEEFIASAWGNYLNVRGIPELSCAINEANELVLDIVERHPVVKDGSISKRSAFILSIHSIMWPLSFGILCNLVIGNLPACFVQLRQLVETATKAFAADYLAKFRDEVFTGIEDLEAFCEQNNISLPKILEDVLPDLIGKNVAKDAANLWRALSREWVHFKGLFKRAGQLPSYVITLPTTLEVEDAEDLRELAESISRARRLLKVLYGSWFKLLEQFSPSST